MAKLNHKGYTAKIEADPETGLLHGEATNAHALLTFAAYSMGEVSKAFEDAIDDYEEWSRERDKHPKYRASL